MFLSKLLFPFFWNVLSSLMQSQTTVIREKSEKEMQNFPEDHSF